MNQTFLNGKTALVTGGAGGIGNAISRHLASYGVHVIMLGKNKTKGQQAVEYIKKSGGNASFISVDLEDRKALQQAAAKLLKKKEIIDILINNAGISGFMGPVIETPTEKLDSVLRVNQEAPFILSKILLPGMIKQGFGRIINISSVAARVNPANSATYNMSKAALNSFTRSLSREVASKGITVNALAPGLVLTERIKTQRLPGLAKATGKTPEQILKSMTLRSDTGRLTTETEIAQSVLFLCSPAAANISGEIIEMSGGY